MDIADVKEILEKRGATIPDDIEIFPYLMSCADNDE
nr:MAG TPA: endoplasmic reticulum chaperone [Caudoviricetes sp.]